MKVNRWIFAFLYAVVLVSFCEAVAPVFNPTVYYATIQENSALGVSVALLTVTDADVNDTITINILSGDDTTPKFTVNNELIVTTATPIDYDTLSGTNYQYTLTITATDTVDTVTATVIVTITGVNEHDPTWDTFSPVFTSSTTPYIISEDSAIGTFIVTVKASDADAGSDGQILYTLGAITSSTSGSGAGLFNIDRVNGDLTTASTLDRDPNTGGVEYYDVIVIASDSGTPVRTVQETIRVGLTDFNDNTPTFSQNIYSMSIPETTAASTSLLTLTATDNDLTSILSYSIDTTSSPTSYTTYFELDTTTTNQLNLKAVVDLDTGAPATFNLVIKVSDGGSPTLTGTTTINVAITTENEHDPAFPSTTVTVNLDEDSGIGTTITQVIASDNDIGTDGDVTHSITSGNNDGRFTIDSVTGGITLAKTLDYEDVQQYNLTVVAVDGGTVSRSATATVTVDVNDISDETPSCNTNSYVESVDETESVGYSVITLLCTDDDASDTLKYSFSSGNTGSKFNININTGEITLAGTLDYDAGTQQFSLVVEVTDDINTLSIPVSVTVNPINENTPGFGTDATVTFAENEGVGTAIVTHVATDTDAEPHDIHRYEIATVTNGGASIFTIDSRSGLIRLAKSLDYESSTSYIITVLAVDGGTPTALTGTGTVTVQVNDVNDVSPSCVPGVHVVSVPENTATGTDVIASFGCTDADTPSLTYSITSQIPSVNFGLVGSPPTLQLSSVLDYETTTSFEIEVTIDDGSSSTIVYVDISVTDVNDGGPTFSSTSYSPSPIAENAAIGTSVFTVAASDPDNSDSTYGQLTYSILSGNTNNKFNIDPNSGKIALAGTLNADTLANYDLVIQILEDSGDNSASTTVSLTVTNVNDNVPTCTSDLAFSKTMAEEGTIGDVIFTLVCTDVDGDNLTYTMTSGDATYFQMNGANLELKAQIDYDTVVSPEFDFVIEVTDGTNTLPVSGRVTVTGVNEHIPTFTQTTYIISRPEDSTPGSLFIKVTATDSDKDDSVSYSWVSSSTDFTIDQLSGEILLSSTLDRETTSSYSLQVVATDGTNAVTATVSITVTDVNDNDPVFSQSSYSQSVSEIDPPGIVVLSVTANDADDPGTNDYGKVTYSISAGDAGVFSIGSTSGQITTISAPNYETATSYTLYIQAIDSGASAGARSSTAIVTVIVTPNNEFDPTFITSSYSVTIAEDEAIGTSILKVSATDTDSGDDGLVYYSMNTHAICYLDSDTGELFIKANLDYETDTSYSFDVIAYDSAVLQRSTTVIVSIIVTDVNDEMPTCTPNFQTVVFAEDYAAGSTIATLTCNDSDATSPNNDLTYAITFVNSAPPGSLFAVSNVGVVTIDTGQSFDFESTTSYSILITATDGGTSALSTTTTVHVDITDYNENNPVFGSPSYTLSLREDTAVSTSVFTIGATDPDTSQTVTYSFQTTSTYFGIDSTSGDIALIAVLDYDTIATNPFELVAVATDDGTNPSARSTSVTITVTVLDDNDVTPVFSPAVYSASISENDNIGKTVTTVTATDSDDASLAYSLVNTFSVFQIDTGGIITIQSNVQDYEIVTGYTLVVHAVDGASNTASTTVHVEVTSYNEFSPVFSPATSLIIIDENTAIGTLVINVNATDSDNGLDGDITYSMTSFPAGMMDKLAIDPTTGVVTVAGSFNREAVTNPLSFTIQAEDGGTTPGGSLTGSFTLTLTISDLNDNAPVCSSSLYSIELSEDSIASTSVVTVTCTDDDAESPNNDVTYFITGGNDGNFEIDSSNGIVTVTTSPTLDRETTATYKLLVEAVDGGTVNLTATATVSVVITDVNDNSPVFNTADNTVNINEDVVIGSTVATVTATDADIGDAGAIEFSIVSGNTDSNLAIDSVSGDVKVVATLDYETTTSYVLILHAVDKLAIFRTGTSTLTVNINDVNDVAPVCTSVLQIFTVPENTIGSTNIGTVSCLDTDTVSYVISSVDAVATTAPFQINSSTGAFDLATGSLDYETDQLKVVIVHAIDGGTPPLTGTVTINVVVSDFNEYDPAFQSTPYSQTVVESANVSDLVAVVTATDSDINNTISYSLTTFASIFSIDPSTGEIYLVSDLDYDTGPVTYEIVVEAADDGVSSRTATATVTITVTDANDGVPVFNPAVYTATISENDPVGTTVTTVTATDIDSVTPSYSIISGNNDGVFRVETSGVVAINDATNLNYDSATKSYTIVVQADDGTNTGTTTVAVVVTNYNDNTPNFATASSTQTLAEDSGSVTVVTVAATDADHSTDGDITYSITSGNAAGNFAVDSSTGVVTLIGSLDMETVQTYTITITATDGGVNPGALTADYFLTVHVSDINDVVPSCTSSLYSVTVLEDVTTNSPITQLICSDKDASNPNNDISTYNIVSGNTNGDMIVSSTGEISNINNLDRETTSSYSLVIEVTDSGMPALSTTTTVNVIISDVNDNTPTFVTNPYHMTTPEDTSVGSIVGTVVANDADSGSAGEVSYTITNGNVDNVFDIDLSTGHIKTIAALDFETSSTNPYVLVIEGSDGDSSTPLTGTTTVSLTITDANDNTPTCNPALQSIELPEDTAASSSIASLTCSDDDSGVNSQLAYLILTVNGASSTLFQVDASGVISTAALTSFDYETTNLYTILLLVTDSATPALSFTSTVNVLITDVNEHDPVFQSTPYTTNHQEHTAVGTSIYTVTATDQDTSGIITCAISPSNIYFDIDPTTCDIYTIAEVDFDSIASPTISLTVVASDNGTPVRSATEVVNITVTDINDGIPSFNPGVYAASINETSAAGLTVTTVTVVDVDDISHTLNFASGNTDNVFRVDTNGDVVINDATNLDYDLGSKNYVLVVQAVDAGSNSATATVVVEVTNVNEHTPTLTQLANNVNIPEDAIATVVDDVDATDNDDGEDGDITYSIISVTNSGTGLFSINPTTGVVSTSGSLDREMQSLYEVTVIAADAGTNPGAFSATYSLTVTITDINDMTPVCTQTLYQAAISEDSVVGTSVAQLTCTDTDSESPNNVISNYTVTGTDFDISVTGEITVATALDRETVDNYNLVIEVIDGGSIPLTATTTLTVIVSDVNDHDPLFINTAGYTFNHNEDIAVGTTIVTVTATDDDIDLYAFNEVLYSSVHSN
ncbi:hypothetical protein ACF0H5_014452 [Mactra antiquata]